ncbi:MAG: ABC transporter ATP-binding protein [Flavobacteriales bacterium]
MAEALRITCAGFGYSGKTIVRAEELAVHTGEVVVLSGRNGSGKSTVLRSICGLQPLTDGWLTISGSEIASLKPEECARRVSIVLTGRPLLTGMDAATLVGMGRFPHHDIQASAGSDARVVSALSAVGMEAFLHRDTATLSDGEMQKVMIARALCQDTPLLLLDEPTAFLDHEARIELMALLRRLAHTMQRAVLFSSHDLSIALSAADFHWKVKDGTILAQRLK